MAGVIILQSQDDPSLRPGPIGIVGYVTGTLVLSGGLAQGSIAYSSGLKLWGLTGGPLVWLGVVGVFMGFALTGLAVVSAYNPSAGAGRGIAILVLAVLSLFTSLLGFFFIAAVLGMVFGALVLRPGLRLPHARISTGAAATPATQVRIDTATDATGAPEAMKGSSRKGHQTYVVFFLLGGAYVILGIVSWLLNRTSLDLLVVGIGGFVLLIGVGFHLAVTRFFPLPPS